MKKTAAAIITAAILGGGLVFAQQTAPVAKATVKAVEVGNKLCPVSGNKVDEMGPPVKVVYKGKRYNLCCSGCIKNFLNDPEKYSKIAQQDAVDTKK